MESADLPTLHTYRPIRREGFMGISKKQLVPDVVAVKNFCFPYSHNYVTSSVAYDNLNHIDRLTWKLTT